jgi:hypothetical protein
MYQRNVTFSHGKLGTSISFFVHESVRLWRPHEYLVIFTGINTYRRGLTRRFQYRKNQRNRSKGVRAVSILQMVKI